MGRPKNAPRKIPAWAWAWLKWRLGKGRKQPAPAPKPPVPAPPAPKPKPSAMFMYDDVNISLIPKTAPAVAGYVGGRWPTWNRIKLAIMFPKAKKLAIAISASENARCLDVEPGDASIVQAAAWVRRQHARGEKLPVLYTSASQGEALIDACTKAGLVYGKDYLWWSAHYTYRQHFCGPVCGFGLKHVAHATQFTDRAIGRSLDESVCSPGFFV